MILQKCTEQKASFNQIVKLEQEISVIKSIEEFPLISKQGEKRELVRQIIRIVEFFLEVTGKSLELYQIQVLSGDLYEKFKYDTIEDIIMMFKMARQGEFGKIYDCKPPEILTWVNYYLDHKAQEREKLIGKQKAIKIEPMTEEARKKFEDLYKSISVKPAEFPNSIKSVVPELFNLNQYIISLPESCKNLSLKELKIEIHKTEFVSKEAHTILMAELNRRNKTSKQ